METKGLKNRIIDLVYELPSRPAYLDRDSIDAQIDGAYLDIILCGCIHIKIDIEDGMDVATADFGGWGYQDLKYATSIMDNRDELLEPAEEWLGIVKEFEELI